jgi:hypothetical protein
VGQAASRQGHRCSSLGPLGFWKVCGRIGGWHRVGDQVDPSVYFVPTHVQVALQAGCSAADGWRDQFELPVHEFAPGCAVVAEKMSLQGAAGSGAGGATYDRLGYAQPGPHVGWFGWGLAWPHVASLRPAMASMIPAVYASRSLMEKVDPSASRHSMCLRPSVAGIPVS